MKRMNLGKLGSFRLERVLVKYEYPILFTCQNDKGRLLLFLEMENNKELEKWVAVDTNNSVLNKLYRKEISIQKAFVNINVRKYYIIQHVFSVDGQSSPILVNPCLIQRLCL